MEKNSETTAKVMFGKSHGKVIKNNQVCFLDKHLKKIIGKVPGKSWKLPGNYHKSTKKVPEM